MPSVGMAEMGGPASDRLGQAFSGEHCLEIAYPVELGERLPAGFENRLRLPRDCRIVSCHNLPSLLSNPTAQFNPDFIQEPANVLIPFCFHQVEVEQEASLVSQEINLDIELF